MGKLITIVGNCGTGKTTFTQHLCEKTGYRSYLEQHIERPFQASFYQGLKRSDHLSALPNQIDYLLYRAEQELEIRRKDVVGVQDGGLEQDFLLFTRLFLHKGYLSYDEYDLCSRFYKFTRALLSPPDMVIVMQAPLEILLQRRAIRQREVDIVKVEDLEILDDYLRGWLSKIYPSSIITIDSSKDDPTYAKSIEDIEMQIRRIVGNGGEQ
jgi:deoxyadenosine/deoxycytidine kinase